MRKTIYLNNIKSNYEIEDSGKIYNIQTKKYLKGSITNSGYIYYRLSMNNIKYRFYAHVLVAKYFLNEINKGKVINHIDGNKTNNSIDNLEYISQSENIKQAHKLNLISKNNSKPATPLYDLENEIWKPTIENKNYLISNCGRVKSLKYGKERILKPSLVNGYYKVVFSENNIKKDYLIHYLVAFNFLNIIKQDGFVINHKDGNKLNNNLDNLEYITISENVNKALYEQNLNNCTREIDCYYNNNFIKTYKSIAMAARELKLDSSSISKVCNGIYSHTHNYTFKYKEGSTTIRKEQGSSELEKARPN